jgi:hypothetical protein
MLKASFKYVWFLLLVLSLETQAQSVAIERFTFSVLNENFESYVDDLCFPLVQSSDSKIDSLINTDLKNRFTGNEYPTESLDSTLIKWASYGIVYLDFQVNFNEQGILSLSIGAEGCGANCTGWTEYYTYNLTNGHYLELNDVLVLSPELTEKIHAEFTAQFKEQKEALANTLHDAEMQLDSIDYSWAMEYYEECENNFDMSVFVISAGQLSVIVDCYFPRLLSPLAPEIELNYTFDELKDYFKIPLHH